MVKFSGIIAVTLAFIFTVIVGNPVEASKPELKQNKARKNTEWTKATYAKRDKLIQKGLSKDTATNIVINCKATSENPEKCIEDEAKNLIDKFPEQAQVIGTFKYGKYDRNVVNIPEWQKEIMDRNKVPFETQLLLRTLNTAECGDENGFCVNRFDAGPFQINQIHDEYTYSSGSVNKGLAQVEEAKKSGNWSGVIKTRNELYEFQMLWTWARMKDQVERFSLPVEREARVYKLAKLHNGSKHKEDYAAKAVISYKILKQYYAKF